jgi:carbamoyl-phosphate synthase large subunit
MVSPPQAVALCLDKLRFAAVLSEWHAPVIPTLTEAGPWQRHVVKERHGAGSRGIGLDLSRDAAIRHATGLATPVFQPFIPGRELSIDCYVDGRGRCLGAVARRREVIVSGESQVTATERHANLEALCADLSVRLGLIGHACWQAIEDAAGGLHLIECNSRVGGASTLSWAAGLDSLAWFLAEAAGGDPAELPFVRVAGELRQIRLPSDTVRPA